VRGSGPKPGVQGRIANSARGRRPRPGADHASTRDVVHLEDTTDEVGPLGSVRGRGWVWRTTGLT
jgi:hypothetical protein